MDARYHPVSVDAGDCPGSGSRTDQWSVSLMVLGIQGQRLIQAGTTGKTVIKHLISTSIPSSSSSPSLSSILDQLGLGTSSSSADLQTTCQEVIKALPGVAMSIKKGNEKPVMRLVGEVMKRSKGRADPKEARKVLLDLIASS